MPRVPQFNPRRKISTDVSTGPTQDVRSAGMVDRANQQLAKGIGDFAFELGKRRALAKRNHASKTFASGISSVATDQEADADKYYEGHSWEGYHDENVGVLKGYIDNAVANAPTQQIADDLRISGESFLAKKSATYRSKEKLKTSIFYEVTDKKVRLEIFSDLRKNPDFQTAASKLDSSETYLKLDTGNIHTTASAQGVRSSNYRFATSTLEGLLDVADVSSLSKAEDFLAGKEPGTERLLNALNGKQIAAYKNRIQRIRDNNQTLYESKVSSKVDIMAKAMSLGTLDITKTEVAHNILATDKELKAFKNKAKAASLSAKLWTGVQENSLKSRLLYTTKNDRTNLEKTFPAVQELKTQFPFLSAATEAEMKDNSDKIIANMDKEIAADAPKFFSQHDSIVQVAGSKALDGDSDAYTTYKSQVDNHYDTQEVPQHLRTYASPEMKRGFGEGIRNAIQSRDFITAVGLYNQIDSMAGDDAEMIRRELGLNPQYEVIGDIDTNQRETALKLITNKDLKSQFEKRGGSSTKEDIESIEAELRQNPLYKATNLKGGNLQGSRSNADAMVAIAYQNYQDLVAQGASKEAAVAGAWQLFSNKKTLDSDHYSVTIPPNSNAEKIIKVMEYYTSDRAPSDVFSPAEKFDIKTSGQSKEAMNLSIRKTGIWVNSPDKSGAELWARTETGFLQPVFNNKGSVVSMSFNEMEDHATNLPEIQSQSQLVSEIIKARIERNRKRLFEAKKNL